MSYSKTKVWMPIEDTRRYLRFDSYGAIAILEDEDKNIIIRIRGIPSQLDIDCEDICEAKRKFKTIAKILGWAKCDKR